MASTIPYSLILLGLVLSASLVVLGQGDNEDPPHSCDIITSCEKCVTHKIHIVANSSETNNGTCIWEFTTSGAECRGTFAPGESTISAIWNVKGCSDTPNTTTTTTTPAPTTVPTNGTTTTTTTTPAPTTVPTNGTTTTTTTTPAPTTVPTNGTTTVAPTNGTTTTTPIPPSNTTTTLAPTPAPKPTPRSGGFSWASFIGGIVFAAALSSLAYLIWRFYKVRLDRNYHTLSTNLI